MRQNLVRFLAVAPGLAVLWCLQPSHAQSPAPTWAKNKAALDKSGLDKAALDRAILEQNRVSAAMKEGMRGGLGKKVAEGKASHAEKERLLVLFTDLSKTPAPVPLVDAENWKSKTGVLVEAAKAAVKGDDDAGKKLRAAANCALCHNRFPRDWIWK